MSEETISNFGLEDPIDYNASVEAHNVCDTDKKIFVFLRSYCGVLGTHGAASEKEDGGICRWNDKRRAKDLTEMNSNSGSL